MIQDGFATLCDWSRKLLPPPQPTRWKSMTNRDQFTRASSSLQFEFSLVNDDDYLG